MLIRSLLASLIALLVFTAAPAIAEACSCMPSDVVTSYNNADIVVAAKIKRQLKKSPAGTKRYRANVRHNFKGCYDKKEKVIVQTASSSAACGVNLKKGQTYLLNGQLVGFKKGKPVISVNLCDYNVETSDLSDSDLDYLLSRYNCCGNDCGCTDGSAPVNCFADPCKNSECNAKDASCTANYCGGCFAEWTTANGSAVCEEECLSDSDCSAENWCRPDQDGFGQCVPFANAGETCGGFTVPWMLEKCDPALMCVPPADGPIDLPGTCASCEYDGQAYQAGDAFPAVDKCNTCSCLENGTVVCTKVACIDPDPNPCVVAGCSGQLCVPKGSNPITTCEWLPEYACFEYANCGPFGASDSCSWASTPAYNTCMSNLGH